MKNAPCYTYVGQNAFASGREKTLSHRSAPRLKAVPQSDFGECLLNIYVGPTLTLYAGIRQKHIRSNEDVRGDMIWQPLCYTENCPGLPKTAKSSQ